MIVFTATDTINNKVFVGTTRLDVAENWENIVAQAEENETEVHQQILKVGASNFKVEEWAFAEDLSEQRELVKEAQTSLNATVIKSVAKKSKKAKKVSLAKVNDELETLGKVDWQEPVEDWLDDRKKEESTEKPAKEKPLTVPSEQQAKFDELAQLIKKSKADSRIIKPAPKVKPKAEVPAPVKTDSLDSIKETLASFKEETQQPEKPAFVSNPAVHQSISPLDKNRESIKKADIVAQAKKVFGDSIIEDTARAEAIAKIKELATNGPSKKTKKRATKKAAGEKAAKPAKKKVVEEEFQEPTEREKRAMAAHHANTITSVGDAALQAVLAKRLAAKEAKLNPPPVEEVIEKACTLENIEPQAAQKEQTCEDIKDSPAKSQAQTETTAPVISKTTVETPKVETKPKAALIKKKAKKTQPEKVTPLKPVTINDMKLGSYLDDEPVTQKPKTRIVRAQSKQDKVEMFKQALAAAEAEVNAQEQSNDDFDTNIELEASVEQSGIPMSATRIGTSMNSQSLTDANNMATNNMSGSNAPIVTKRRLATNSDGKAIPVKRSRSSLATREQQIKAAIAAEKSQREQLATQGLSTPTTSRKPITLKRKA